MFFEITKIMVDGDAGNGCIVDHGKPLFSWAAEHEENGAAQSAYRITVRNGNNIKWNTGWVESHKQSAQYAGMPLEAGAELEWTVTIRDEQGRQTQPKSGMFRTGHMGDWDAGWITTPWDHEGETKCVRKTFILKDGKFRS